MASRAPAHWDGHRVWRLVATQRATIRTPDALRTWIWPPALRRARRASPAKVDSMPCAPGPCYSAPNRNAVQSVRTGGVEWNHCRSGPVLVAVCSPDDRHLVYLRFDDAGLLWIVGQGSGVASQRAKVNQLRGGLRQGREGKSQWAMD